MGAARHTSVTLNSPMMSVTVAEADVVVPCEDQHLGTPRTHSPSAGTMNSPLRYPSSRTVTVFSAWA